MNLSKYCADPGKKNRHKHLEQMEYEKSGGTPPRRSKFSRRLLWGLLILLLIVLIVSGVLILPLLNRKAGHTALIRVPENASEEQVRDSVAKYFGDDYADYTLRAMRIIKNEKDIVRHGAWLITDNMSPFEAARTLGRRGQTGITIALNSLRTPEDVACLLSSRLEFSKQDMLNALNDEDLLRAYDTDPEHVLCFFLEDNYEFFWTATPEEVIAKMRDNYRQYWSPERRDMADELGLSTRDIVILASIVDAETNFEGEKGTIGRLYINRLEKDMKLQSDPTVKYAARDFGAKRVGGEMLRTDSPYNTYMYEGLPPGPIRLTSKATIDAILTSRPNDYLYMCADESLNGTHNFAITYEEHLRNADKYKKELDRRGIKLADELEDLPANAPAK